MMTAAEGHALKKRFDLRRSGQAAADPADDEQYLDALRVLEPPEAPGLPRPGPRPLNRDERELVREGRMNQIRGEVNRVDVLLARDASRTTLDRAASARRAERAQREAERLMSEAKRFG